uniref:Odorant receptor n=1 Tax=Ctenopseustis obliquana TaxID=65030 RepID=A0A097IYI1_9NEOP|nr:olfactory receptor 14 [Ctenopseustis obliquana]
MEPEFKPFRETYKIITFNMIVGMLYPTPETDRRRAIGIGVAMASVVPITALATLDMWHSWQRKDIVNITRHCTVIGPLFGVLFKMVLFFINRADVYRIIKSIDADHARYNTLPEPYKAIARNCLSDSMYYSEYLWAWIVGVCVLTFPCSAAGLNVYNCLFKAEPTLYLVHDVENPFAESEDRFDSPFFEIMFVYMTCMAVLYILNFTGFDAFFGLTINHVCMKIELLCMGLDDAMLEIDSNVKFEKMVEVIKEHNNVFKMVDLLQETFNIWLGIILIATMAQICNCMYQVLEGYGIDPRYLVFIWGTVVHIYMPCRYAAKLQAAAADIATRAHCSGWERSGDLRTRRMVVFVMARAQVPVNITAFNIINFDMELFVSVSIL